MNNQPSNPDRNRRSLDNRSADGFCDCASQRQHALHRIAAVRQQEGVSLRQLRSLMKIGLPELRRQERPSTDLQLSELYRWQQALKVPVAELLSDPPERLSPSLVERTRMVRAMKTALSIVDRCDTPEVKQLAQQLVAELNEVIPGLDSVGSWPLVQQRNGKDFGRTLEFIISTQLIDDQ